PPIVSRTVRGLVKGSPVYLVPRADGEVVLGATQEEMGDDTRLTAGGVWELLRDGHELVPGISELEIAETCVGLRPAAPDNEPLLGPTRLPGLHLAAGHFRHGVLFTPATGDAMAEALTTGELPDYARRFAATRLS
ncbi:FAD-dependent oxidoreductase, partial [Nocardiopsis gilva]